MGVCSEKFALKKCAMPVIYKKKPQITIYGCFKKLKAAMLNPITLFALFFTLFNYYIIGATDLQCSVDGHIHTYCSLSYHFPGSANEVFQKTSIP